MESRTSQGGSSCGDFESDCVRLDGPIGPSHVRGLLLREPVDAVAIGGDDEEVDLALPVFSE